jgi:hypothetical protein
MCFFLHPTKTPIRFPKEDTRRSGLIFEKSHFTYTKCTPLVSSTLQPERQRTTCDVLSRKSHTFWIHAGTFDYHGAGRRDRSPSCDDQGSSRNTVAPSCDDPGSRLQCLLKVFNLLYKTSHSENFQQNIHFAYTNGPLPKQALEFLVWYRTHKPFQGPCA